MKVLLNLVLAVQMLSAVGMIGLILVQHGKGADMGAAFGSGGSGSLFGASGSANFMSRTTAVLAALFFSCTLLLAYFSNVPGRASTSVLEGAALPTSSTASVPASAASASGAAQIPAGNSAASAALTAASAVAAAPTAAASGAAQIPK